MESSDTSSKLEWEEIEGSASRMFDLWASRHVEWGKSWRRNLRLLKIVIMNFEPKR